MASTSTVRSNRACLYNVRWQCIRVNLLGSWNSVSGVKENLMALESYLLEVALCKVPTGESVMTVDEFKEAAARYTRIINYLNAIRMGYSGQGLQSSEMDELVKKYRNKLQTERTEFRIDRHGIAEENSKTVRGELQALYWNDRELFKTIYTNLKRRKGNAIRRHSTAEHRPELMQFLGMMEAIQ